MIAITLTEFRKNYKEYLERSENERVILTNKGKTYELLPKQRITDEMYFSNPGVIERQRQAEQEEREGKGTIYTAEELRRRMGL
jgi:hypothetical protein